LDWSSNIVSDTQPSTSVTKTSSEVFLFCYDEDTSKLIAIRGPSGSGKSTVAKELQKACPVPTLLIHEDQIRFMFSNWQEPAHTASKNLATAAITMEYPPVLRSPIFIYSGTINYIWNHRC
jgi:ABC-type dipeptide/oligopeptide/nickel transport system ATPase component